MKLLAPWLVVVSACSALDPDVGPLAQPAPIDAGEVVFARDIRPLMARSSTDPAGHGCAACHDPRLPSHVGVDQTALDLSTLGRLRAGGINTRSNIVVVGSPEASALVQKLRGTSALGLRMPKDGPAYWSDDEIESVERWILEGAKGDDSE